MSSKWSNSQTLNGPILSIPLLYEEVNGDLVNTYTRYIHVLPQELTVEGQIEPELLNRGIYKVVVYRSELSVSGNFKINKNIAHSNLKEVRWQEAFMTIGISDLRGIEEELTFYWDNDALPVDPGSQLSSHIYLLV